jgi:hypothetical protein
MIGGHDFRQPVEVDGIDDVIAKKMLAVIEEHEIR